MQWHRVKLCRADLTDPHLRGWMSPRSDLHEAEGFPARLTRYCHFIFFPNSDHFSSMSLKSRGKSHHKSENTKIEILLMMFNRDLIS